MLYLICNTGRLFLRNLIVIFFGFGLDSVYPPLALHRETFLFGFGFVDMKPFNISILAGGKPVVLTVNFINGVYQIIYKSKILCALRPPGEDWQLLSMEEILTALPVYEADLLIVQEAGLILHDPLIVQISGAIESHIR